MGNLVSSGRRPQNPNLRCDAKGAHQQAVKEQINQASDCIEGSANEVAKRCLASAKKQAESASKTAELAKSTLGALQKSMAELQKSMDAAKKNVEITQSEHLRSQNEVEARRASF